jgi:hypothetical protein
MLARATARKEVKMVGQWRNEIITYTATLARFNAKRRSVVMELIQLRKDEHEKAQRFIDGTCNTQDEIA